MMSHVNKRCRIWDVESHKLLVWKTLENVVIVPFIASLCLIQVSVITHVMLHIWPSCEEGNTLAKEISGSAVYKHTIPNCCSASYMMTLWAILVSCDVLQFTLPAVFVAIVMKVLIYQGHIHYQ